MKTPTQNNSAIMLLKSASWADGVESAEIDNTTNEYVYADVGVKDVTCSSVHDTIGQEINEAGNN
jgi:hypothetical protein